MTTLHWQQTHPAWNFWLRWMLATVLGAALYLIVSVPLMALLTLITFAGARPEAEPAFVPNFIGAGFGMGLTGAAIGLAQWFVLRKLLHNAGWWVLATMIGYSAPYVVGAVLPQWPEWLAPASMFVTFGLVFGIAQGLVLRAQVTHAAWWIPISLAGWLAALALTRAAILSGLYIEPFDMLSAFLVPPAISGIGLTWLLPHDTLH